MTPPALPDGDLILAVSVCYVGALFVIAYIVDARARRGEARWISAPLVYTLSLTVYCTSWTFYGAVGSAARSGLEFMAIYLGPTLVFVGWWVLIRKLVRIGRVHRITSIADMLSSRYGKSGALGALATLIAVIATTPYIALQLQSLTASYEALTGTSAERDAQIAFWVAACLAVFTILFATRTLDENERHYGVVAAIAVEALIKLSALIAVGWFTVFSVGGGLSETFEAIEALELQASASGPRWLTLLFLSAAAIICLPRQFQVMVVENSDDRQLATASWAFPGYLLLTCLFVLPIAGIGNALLAGDTHPDLFVLTLPLAHGNTTLAIFSFIGGLSAATSMVIVSVTALATMVSNHMVPTVVLRRLMRPHRRSPDDMRRALLNIRRIAILAILALGYVYFRISGRSEALAATGLVAFCGVAQFLPALVAGIVWRNATLPGAFAGLLGGFALWVLILYIPSLGGVRVLPGEPALPPLLHLDMFRHGVLAPPDAGDPLVRATVWSLCVNTALLIGVSLLTRAAPLERLQGALFVDVFRAEAVRPLNLVRRTAHADALFELAESVLGPKAALELFQSAAARQGKATGDPEPTPAFISRLERELAGSVGAASAHAMMRGLTGREQVSMEGLGELADENAMLRHTTEALQRKSDEAERTTAQLRAANERLISLDAQKDDFLRHVSHELRTPMTSVRSFAEILRDTPDLDPDQRAHFADIIQSESIRLIGLLDEIRDLSFLEEQSGRPPLERADAQAILRKSVEVALGSFAGRAIKLVPGQNAGRVEVLVNADRLSQVFINVIANAILHNDKAEARLRIDSRLEDRERAYVVDISDNGPGIRPEMREQVFEPFVRGTSSAGCGLGLAISARIVESFGGALSVSDGPLGGARFRIRLNVVDEKNGGG